MALPGLSVPIAEPQPGTVVLVVQDDAQAVPYVGLLRNLYRVAATSDVGVAKTFLHRTPPSLVLTELALKEQSGVEVCREAKALAAPPPVLVITADANRVPDALVAGCDGVLLKPFPPNLLFARIGRLLRARSGALRMKAQHQQLKAAHLLDRSESMLAGSNRAWPTTHCPYCNHFGVTSFEYASHRRAWYACLECRKVWIAKRQE